MLGLPSDVTFGSWPRALPLNLPLKYVLSLLPVCPHHGTLNLLAGTQLWKNRDGGN